MTAVRVLRPILPLLRRATGGWVAAVVLAAIAFVPAAALTLQFKHIGERRLQAQQELQVVVSELHTQDALEWRSISGHLPTAEATAELTSSRERAQLLTSRITAPEHKKNLEALNARYARAVDEELRLLRAGREVQAAEVDETVVDPAFDKVLDAAQDYDAVLAADAARARKLGDIGVLLTVGLSLGVTALVQGRRRYVELRRRTERKSEARYRALVDQSSDVVLVTDRRGSCRFLSPSAERLLAPHFGPESVDGQGLALAQAVHPGDRDVLEAALEAIEPTCGSTIELRLRGDEGWRTFEMDVQDLSADAAVGGLVLTGHDITERQALQRELEHRALHDGLTGLPNRVLLADRFDQALRAAARAGHSDDGPEDGRGVGLLLIDLDRFKEINDTLGHHYGDELLVQIGPRLVSALRDGDTVARLGGDEFAVLLPDARSLEAAVAVATTLQATLARSFCIDGVELGVEASIGVVMSGLHGTDAAILMQRADIAMYVAKQRSLGIFAYDREADSNTPERLSLLGDLRRALDNEELFLHFQPKVSLSTGEVVGAEALLRWQHPTRGLIPPDAFIPLAENTGLIGPITRYVLDRALAQAARWAEAGEPLQVAVNLSARNLLDDQLDAKVAEQLAAHGVPAHRLTLEVTESAIMTDPVRARELLERLAARGVAISIDDFGAGYTSLGQLKDLPITELKIDRSFVLAMQGEASDSLIVRSVIDLGHNLGLSAVAEGVETAAALQDLSGFGCDVAQGFLLCRPLTAEAFDRWRTAWPRQAEQLLEPLRSPLVSTGSDATPA
ncbi:MAG: hypothetical protein QOE19_2250 [Actinomycetota bacterium]|jgi:diguanylate cyclase (GGDEF)-like protein/PAS domain S-box-containing protein|nr:hypothetical protein [Actinomycetota bacterium]